MGIVEQAVLLSAVIVWHLVGENGNEEGGGSTPPPWHESRRTGASREWLDRGCSGYM